VILGARLSAQSAAADGQLCGKLGIIAVFLAAYSIPVTFTQ
jgi:hypothetical protein